MLLHLTPSSHPLMPYNPDSLIAVQRTVRRIFGDVATSNLSSTSLKETQTVVIRFDVKEDEKAFHVITDLPGLSENEVDVLFEAGVLTVRGSKKIERDDKKENWHIVERPQGNFARQISLPAAIIDTTQIDAKFDKGVLSITLPKKSREQDMAKKITIKVG